MATTIGDLVLVHVDKKPGFYARIEDILLDVKAGWWRVKLLVLTVPLEVYTWILEETQINGTPFTMGGTPVRLEKIESPVVREESPPPSPPPADPSVAEAREPARGGKVVSLLDRKKDK
ncbi:hypothetical protein [Geobacter sp.]|uniref:hypothetical protein n=1 Tax=Geobacter sp. TaxID=46610 RepID=UPI002618605B|nr:hypothetical protein [Geobacter sp.]